MKINLVFEGGGVRGIASAVAAYVLDLNGYEAVAFGGASVGAYLAAMRAAGHDARDALRCFAELNLRKFMDVRPWAWLQRGLCCGNYIERTAAKFCGDATFEELKYPLKIAATNMTRLRVEILSRETWPGMRVSKAVRLSCSIPFVYRPGHYNGDLWFDGGLLENFPVNCFDSTRRTVGILLKGHEYDPPRWWELALVAPALTSLMMKASEVRHYQPAIWRNVVEVDTGRISATDFLLSAEERKFLARAGIAGAVEFMEKKECIEPAEMVVPDEREIYELMGIR